VDWSYVVEIVNGLFGLASMSINYAAMSALRRVHRMPDAECSRPQSADER
jgi:hypothetical protein